ncbi:hypothetical protein GC197_13070 [bacterium]|nr:hypothetical protein [bacterium]
MTDSNNPFRLEGQPQAVAKKDDSNAKITLIDLIAAVVIAILVIAAWSLTKDAQLKHLIVLIVSIPRLIVTILGGAALFHFGRRFMLGQSIGFQPGHWLLCLHGTNLIYFAVYGTIGLLYLAFKNILPIPGANEPDVSFANVVPATVLTAGVVLCDLIFVVLGLILPVRFAWRLLLIRPVMHALLLIVQAILFAATASMMLEDRSKLLALPGYAFLLNEFFALVLVVVLAIWDCTTTNDRRDYIHWAGVAAAGLLSGSILFFQLTLRFWF